MSSVLFTSLSSLVTQGKRLQISADNVANFASVGFVRGPGGESNGGFAPQRLEQVSTHHGGVRGNAVAIEPASVPVFQPDHSAADENGFVPRPNVNLEQEFVTQIIARRAYQASLKMIAEEDERLRILNDLLA